MKKTNTILKHPVNKFFTVKNTYYHTNQKEKTRKQKFNKKVEAGVIGDLKIKCKC